MSTWRYTNTRAEPVLVHFDARVGGSGALLPAGQTLEFAAAGWSPMLVLPPGDRWGHPFASGAVQDLAQPGAAA